MELILTESKAEILGVASFRLRALELAQPLPTQMLLAMPSSGLRA